MSKLLPGVYDINGAQVTVEGDWVVIKPVPEGRARPSPAQGAASALGAIATLPTQPGLTVTGSVQAPAGSGSTPPPHRLVIQQTAAGPVLVSNRTGQRVFLQGVNQGSWLKDVVGDPAMVAGWGATCIRRCIRYKGIYSDSPASARTLGYVSGTVTDSWQPDGSLHGYLKLDNVNTLLARLAEDRAAGIWSIVFLDSNCIQSGAQDAATMDYCTVGAGGAAAWPLGRNFATDSYSLNLHALVWQFLSALLAPLDNIAYYELLPEPLSGADSTYKGIVKTAYRTWRSVVKANDPNGLFLIGGRDAYNLAYMDEAYLSECQDVAYTGDELDPVMGNIQVLPTKFKNMTDMRTARSVPVFGQQLGRKSQSDPNLYCMRAGLSLHLAWQVEFTYWQLNQNGTSPLTDYGLFYQDGNGGRIAKQPEIDCITSFFQLQAGGARATLEAAAISAAQAAGATLLYVKSDLSNAFQDAAGTVPVTAIGQPVACLKPVVGSGFNLVQSGASATAPTLVATANSAYIGGAYAMNFDGATQYLQGSVPYIAPGDDMTVVVAGTPGNPAAAQVALHIGTSASTVRYPYVSFTNAQVARVNWTGDDGVTHGGDGTLTWTQTPTVVSAVKAGATKRNLTCGVAEVTDTTTVGSIASITRMRVGCTTAGGSFFQGPIALVCVAKGGMTDAQRAAIERWAAFLEGSFCQV